MKVGQKVYVKYLDRGRYNPQDIQEATISKIGRKYFELNEFRHSRLYLDSFIEDGGQYSPRYKVYVSKQAIVDEEESDKLFKTISLRFGYFKNPYTLEQLRKVADILELSPD